MGKKGSWSSEDEGGGEEPPLLSNVLRKMALEGCCFSVFDDDALAGCEGRVGVALPCACFFFAAASAGPEFLGAGNMLDREVPTFIFFAGRTSSSSSS